MTAIRAPPNLAGVASRPAYQGRTQSGQYHAKAQYRTHLGGGTGPTTKDPAAGLIGDPSRLGLDAIFPTFFLALLIGELQRPGTRGVAAAGAAVALLLVPFTPPGVPIVAASVAALVGLRMPRDPADGSKEQP